MHKNKLTMHTLSDNSFSTSFLTRRSINGLSIMCNRLSWSVEKYTKVTTNSRWKSLTKYETNIYM